MRQTTSLDGTWRIVFDRDNIGRRERWQASVDIWDSDGRDINVPSCWETLEQDYEGVAWYRYTFTAPALPAGSTATLQFAAANYRAEVWLNGTALGYHDGGYTPFGFDVADLLRTGEDNDLVVRVVGPLITRDTVIDGIGLNETPHWRGAIAGGLWQGAQLVTTGPVRIADLFVEPLLDEAAAQVHLTLENTAHAQREIALTLAISDATGEQQRLAVPLTLPPGTEGRSYWLPLQTPIPWTPANPHLYTLAVEIEDTATLSDALTTRFGMRTFTVENGHFWLNGEPIAIKAGFWEALYPTTLANPPGVAMVRREIELAKAMGFNMLRPWRKPLQPWILDLADEMGLLLIGAFPIECMDHWPEVSPQLVDRMRTEVREAVLRDRNHASLVWWELLNEVRRPELGRMKHELALLARGLDPSRLIADESGGWYGGAHLYLPYETTPRRFNELHWYLPAPVDHATYDYIRTLGAPGGPQHQGIPMGETAAVAGFLSEVGFGGLSDLPRDVARYAAEGNPITPDYRYHAALLASLERLTAEQDLVSVYSTPSALCLDSQAIQAAGNKLQVEAARLNPHLAGYVVHAYTDGDWVYGAGILDMWREPKQVYHTLAEANAPRYLAIRLASANVVAGRPARLTLTGVNDLVPVSGRLSVTLSDACGEVTHTLERQVALPAGIGELLVEDLPTGGLRGPSMITARLLAGDELLSRNTFGFVALPPEAAEPSPHPFRVLDDDGKSLAQLRRAGYAATGFTPGTSSALPIVVTSADAASDAHLAAWAAMLDAVRHGATALLLRPPVDRDDRVTRRLRNFYRLPAVSGDESRVLNAGFGLPRLRTRMATGNWVPVNHVIKPYPLAQALAGADLPAPGMMGQPYQDIVAVETMLGVEGETLIGSLSYEWNAAPLNYLGCQDFWWGADLAVVPYGTGRLVLSMLRLVDNLGRDPVADVMFGALLELGVR